MRTTIDLPEELLRQAKIAAVQRGSTLRDLVAAALRRELAVKDITEAERAPLPAIHLAEDAPLLKMSVHDIKAVIARDEEAEDLARVD